MNISEVMGCYSQGIWYKDSGPLSCSLSDCLLLARGRDQYLLAACDQPFVSLTIFTLERNAIFFKIEKKISYQIVKFILNTQI